MLSNLFYKRYFITSTKERYFQKDPTFLLVAIPCSGWHRKFYNSRITKSKNSCRYYHQYLSISRFYHKIKISLIWRGWL